MNAVRVVAKPASIVLAYIFIFAFLATIPGLTSRAAAKDTKSVRAVYDIGFNSFNIGSFTVISDMSQSKYSVRARADISVLAGILFSWRGDTSSSGSVLANRPSPDSYTFGYRTSDKRETIDIEFSNNNVKDVAISPPQRVSPSRVPITRKHMRNVVDPLSALVMLTNIGSNKSSREVCTRRLPIFDGKARYDLKLSYKKTKNVSTSHGYQGPAYICKVKFVPIAGHKHGDKEARDAAQNDNMEIWMIPLKEADLYVPYYIYIPTPAGTASLTSSKFSVDNSDASRGARLQ